MTLVSPLIVGIIYCLLMSLIREPHRRRFNAILVGGAGAAYLSGGGFGPWELPFVALTAYVAYRGGLLDLYRHRLAPPHRMGHSPPPQGQPHPAVRPRLIPGLRHLRSGHRPVVLPRRIFPDRDHPPLVQAQSHSRLRARSRLCPLLSFAVGQNRGIRSVVVVRKQPTSGPHRNVGPGRQLVVLVDSGPRRECCWVER